MLPADEEGAPRFWLISGVTVMCCGKEMAWEEAAKAVWVLEHAEETNSAGDQVGGRSVRRAY